jgi:lipopolysaccharide biosynthesis regulator YciM
MDFESWWLIFLPLLFGLGWLAARFDFRQMLTETRALPDSYFKGLNFLLNEQPDRAIDAFIEVAKLDPETTELHFALGSLFRRRGEMERAIRVHQSLLSRSDLPSREREHALNEIAQDYLKAGMLDRAELAYKELRHTRYEEAACRALVRIYESEHDWPQAIEAVKRLGKLTGESVAQLVHYHCEMAHNRLTQKPIDLAAARVSLDLAQRCIEQDAESTEASQARLCILDAALARAEGDLKSERQALLVLLDRAPEYAGLVADGLQQNYAATHEGPELLRLLQVQYEAHPSLDLFGVIFKLINDQSGAPAAWAFAHQALTANPTLLGLEYALRISDASPSATPMAQMDSEWLQQLIARHTQRLERYGCRVCGFQAKAFYWQCPGCHGWETYPPRRMEELQ